jgi:hypothetical protein
MTKVSRSTWASTLASNIQDNTSEDILPSEVRTVFNDLEDSVVWWTDTLTGGHAVTIHAIGTVSSGTVTPDFANGNMQTLTNGGAFTLQPPAASGVISIEVTNNSSAGAVTTSAFDSVTGDTLTTTNGHRFILTIRVFGARSYLTIEAAVDNA